ncbi:MAG: hypothetical protein AAF253_04210 [Pseudomonadota bacterium]
MSIERDLRGHHPEDDAIGLNEGLLPEDLQGLTTDDIAGILASTETLEARHQRLVSIRDQLETLSHTGGEDVDGAGAVGTLISAVEGALQRLEHGRSHPGGRYGAGLDPDGRADTQSPDDLLADDWRLSVDPTHL